MKVLLLFAVVLTSTTTLSSQAKDSVSATGGIIEYSEKTGLATLKSRPSSASQDEAATDGTFAETASQKLVTTGGASVELFYPKPGQPTGELCWQGLFIDRNSNLYPIGGGNIYKLLSSGKMVNGVGDTNFFSSAGDVYWVALKNHRSATTYHAPGHQRRVAVRQSLASALIAVRRSS